MSRVSIIVPSYRRPERLTAGLRALVRQRRPVDEILVVARQDDIPTLAVVGQTAGVRCIKVSSPGVLAAMRAGASAASGELIGFVDDDAEARVDWLEGVVAHLSDPAVGGVCGRDIVDDEPSAPNRDVGRITAYGKLVANHHLGHGPARDVTVLKGANMVFRRAALALPDGLRGDGAQAHYEVATSLWAVKLGWRLVYDPGLIVDHRAAPRFDDDARGAQSADATTNAAFNLALCIGTLRPGLRRRRLAYGLLVGDREIPGLLRAAVAVLQRDATIPARLVPSLRGQLAAELGMARRSTTLAMNTYPSPDLEIAQSALL